MRPFSVSAEVSCREYSMRLQRVLTDFGADESFGQAVKKIREHYGIEVPASTTRLKVEKHAAIMQIMHKKDIFKSSARKMDCIIGEADGGMVPIVAIKQKSNQSDVKNDRRKNKKLLWKEAVLTLARGHKTVQPYFSASMGMREDAGKHLAQCASLAGRHEKTRVHCLGDGATWIAEQIEQEFGADATFTIDFYHLSQYLAQAAQCIQPNDLAVWLVGSKTLMLENQSDKVFHVLQEHINLKSTDHKDCSAEKCFNYMDKRRKYLNYKEALDAGLPIGSGEIESGIRSVVQHRLKKPGAWWLHENADAMLSLATVRINGFWDQYWRHQRIGTQGNAVQG